jgi:signal transduction histidine kinase
MPDGGTLTLIGRIESASACASVREDQEPEACLPSALPHARAHTPHFVALDVIDTGHGIPPEVLPKLFRPFQTTKANGNGLGLATTRKIVAAHGGTIDVQSEPGRGTKFTIRLPAAVTGAAS